MGMGGTGLGGGDRVPMGGDNPGIPPAPPQPSIEVATQNSKRREDQTCSFNLLTATMQNLEYQSLYTQGKSNHCLCQNS